ncbi:hypothetical protein ACFQZ4_43100 [Catellatospora coxensis]|uniref:Uncharacterized protein n=1 Tax=Catellatospora coxensis TaxID=310354 RepID=A0A8J3L324_9ACTN|nr:hypothetical protein [Catellatospora coxensis]GIG11585.1 hypothetical protein Cco03nite_82850 [Catellatospora coxensis]
MGADLTVEPEAMRRAATAFRDFRETVENAGRVFDNPVLLDIGDFETSQAFGDSISEGIGQWRQALNMISATFDRSAGVLDSASRMLTDADESNDDIVLDDIDAIGS